MSSDPATARLRQAEARLTLAQRVASPWAMTAALIDVARGCADVGAPVACERVLAAALDWSRLTGSIDQVVDLLCELCETAETLAAEDEAQRPGSSIEARQRAHAYAAEAARLAAQVSDPAWEVKVLLRVSDVLDGMGSHSEAIELQCRAMTLMSPGAVAVPLHDGPTSWSEFAGLTER